MSWTDGDSDGGNVIDISSPGIPRVRRDPFTSIGSPKRYDDNRAKRVMHDLITDGAEHQTTETVMAPSPYDDKIRFIRGGDDRVRSRALRQNATSVDPAFANPLHGLVKQRLSGFLKWLRVEGVSVRAQHRERRDAPSVNDHEFAIA